MILSALKSAAMRAALLAAASLVGATTPAVAAPDPIKVPVGIAIRLTPDGPVFTDAAGMTLYYGEATCDGSREARVRPIDSEGDVAFMVTVRRARSCLEKTPPVLAAVNAQPFGAWSLVPRPDGARQWAYQGRLLFRSAKDKVPGDVNGGYLAQLARGESPTSVAPLAGLPPGVKTRQTIAGLTLTDTSGRTLYVRSGRSPAQSCDKACATSWTPFVAPILASPGGLTSAWSIVTGPGGVRQWAVNGRGLFTYRHDAASNGEQVYGDVFGSTWPNRMPGWSPAVLIAAPRPPAGVIAQKLTGDPQLFSFGLASTVYADLKGHPLYTMHCIDGGSYEGEPASGVDCDDVGDDPRYWLTYCGGEAGCQANWRPFVAAPDAKSIDRTWTVVVVNPKNPFAPLSGRGVRVWAFKGRPVFTYAHDHLPGDFYGDDHGFGTTGYGQMQARPIPAQTYGPANPPVMAPSAVREARR